MNKELSESLQNFIAKNFKSNWWPAYKHRYSFTEDWFTYRIATWKKLLAPLKARPNLRALEIGTYEGRSALWLLENILTDETSKVVCIDSYPGPLRQIEDTFRKNIKRGGFEKRVNLYVAPSQTVVSGLNENFDLIYIDGHHEGEQITIDAEACWSCLKPGGILIFDDYKWPIEHVQGESPEKAIDDFISRHNLELEVLHKDYQVFVQKK